MIRTLFSSALQREWRLALLVGVICFAVALTAFSFVDPLYAVSWISHQPAPIPEVILSSVLALGGTCVAGFAALIGIVRQNMRITAALDNMTQGLCMFDGATRLIICNDRYLEMYGLTREQAYPGCSLRELLEYRKATGTFYAGHRRIRRGGQAARRRGTGLQQRGRDQGPHHLDREPPDRRAAAGSPRTRTSPSSAGRTRSATAWPRRSSAARRSTPRSRRSATASRSMLKTVGDNAGAMRSTATTLFAASQQDLRARRRRGRYLERSLRQRRDRRLRGRGAVLLDRRDQPPARPDQQPGRDRGRRGRDRPTRRSARSRMRRRRSATWSS